MLSSFNIIYLLVSLFASVILIFILRAIQNSALSELGKCLYVDNDSIRYFKMLDNKRLNLILRKGTLLILKLDGYIFINDELNIEKTAQCLENIRLSQAEKLNFYQKYLSFALTKNKSSAAYKALNKLQLLLQNEKDDKLKEILEDSQLLVKIYIEHDVNVISKLKTIENKQSGKAKGITQYRLAKLFYFKGDNLQVMEYLHKASNNLRETEWSPIIDAAILDRSILEVK